MIGLRLRSYQQEAVDQVRSAIRAGCRRPLVTLPTGAGKTLVFGAFAREEAQESGGRCLILAHREELLDQAHQKLGLVWPEAQVGVVQGSRAEYGARDVVVASIATLARPGRLAQLGQVDRVVCDEAHHVVAGTWRGVLHDLGVFGTHGPPCVGVTATPGRADLRGLGAVFQRIVYERSILWMMMRGYLCDLRTLVVRTDVSVDSVRIGHDGDFDAGALGSVLNTANRNALIVQTYREHCRGRKALAFVATVKHAEDLAATFRASGVAAEAVSGQSTSGVRHRVIGDFRAGRLQVLCNAAVLTEGYDDASVAAILLARPTRSAGLYTQMVGRGLRPHPRKSDCLLVDYADASRHHSLAGLPSLWPTGAGKEGGRPPIVVPGKGESVMDALVASGRLQELGLPLGVDVRVQDVGSLVAQSRFRWRSIGNDLVLALGGGRYVELRQEARSDLYAVGLVADRQWRPLADRPLDIGFAEGVAEDYVREHGLTWNQRDASWRQLPASDRQKQFLENRGLAVPATRGEADDAISAVTLQWRA